jgi:hypothetical protein
MFEYQNADFGKALDVEATKLLPLGRKFAKCGKKYDGLVFRELLQGIL